jgi:hypothetical protein
MTYCGNFLKTLLGENMNSGYLPVSSLTGYKDFLLSVDLNLYQLTLHNKEANRAL